jgi:predicted ATPase
MHFSVRNRAEKTATNLKVMNEYLSQGRIQAKRSAERGMVSQPTQSSYDYNTLRVVNILETVYAAVAHKEFVNSLTDKLFALAALRDEPQRSGPRTDERIRVGSRGQNTVSVFHNLRQRAVRAGRKHSLIRDDYERLEKWIKRLRVADTLEVTNWRDLLDMRASFGGGKQQSHSIVDLGIGVSQSLPILVQLAVVPRNSLLILEQPELHLYPWAQSELGQILCDEAKRGDKSMIIETHSEHIVRGIQQHISFARTSTEDRYLRADDIQVLFVHGDGKVQRLNLSETGEFEEQWPSGFFDQGLKAFDVIISNKMAPTAEGVE